ncbi:hypothetical protein JW711_06445 [Candidatus Woesearchaeota archaeon]|nr:hypothetical protein [Candidatus Woesearchaeota archaeon]
MNIRREISDFVLPVESVVKGRRRVSHNLWERLMGKKSGHAIELKETTRHYYRVLDANNQETYQAKTKSKKVLWIVDKSQYESIPDGKVYSLRDERGVWS